MSNPALAKGAPDHQVVEKINRILQGKINAVTTVTLDAGATTTTLRDPRLSIESYIGLTPRSATAATAIATASLYVSAKTSGEATLTHDSTADLDRIYDVLIIG